MDSKSMLAASRVFNLLVYGGEADRQAAQAALNDPGQTIDRPHLRLLILNALSREFYPGKENEEQNPEVVWIRSWLLGTLGRISDDDPETGKVIKKHLDLAYEPDRWVRYWTLEGLVAARVSNLEPLAQDILKREREPLVLKLAEAILVSKGDSHSLQEIQKGLAEPESQWATLRALRVVPILATVKRLCEIVEGDEFSNEKYDAIIALGQVPSTASSHAEISARTLTNFIAKYRRSPFWDGLRTKAIIALGNLKVESTAPMLIEVLNDDNPAIVRDAARALEKVLGIRTAAARVVEAASKAGRERIVGFASSLRWMDRGAVVDELAAAMVSGPADQQEVARILLSEMGGTAAFQKLRARTAAMAQYTTVLEEAERKIRDLFEGSIQEARTGFKLATLMDMIVFFLGVGLLAVSAGLVLSTGGTLNNWAGVGVTGGAGFLGVVYGILIAKPRQQVREAVDHLMYLKVIFLAYLRQLHQADQAYTRRLLEDEKITPEEVDKFSNMVGTTMRIAVEQLTLPKSTAQEEKSKARSTATVPSSNPPPAVGSESRKPQPETH